MNPNLEAQHEHISLLRRAADAVGRFSSFTAVTSLLVAGSVASSGDVHAEIVDDVVPPVPAGSVTNVHILDIAPPLQPQTDTPVAVENAACEGRFAAVNLTVTEPRAPGFLQIFLNPNARGLTSNVNFMAGETASNFAFAPVDPEGDTRVYNSAEAHVILDVVGNFAEGSVCKVPEIRLLDTRGESNQNLPPGAGSLTELNGAPNTQLAVNLTAIGATGPGNLQIVTSRDSADLGKFSSVNYSTGQTVAGETIIEFGDDGKAYIYSPFGNVHFAVDPHMEFMPGTLETVTEDHRKMDTRDPRFGEGKLGAGESLVIPGLKPNRTALVSLIAVENSDLSFLQVQGQGVVPGATSNLNLSKQNGVFRNLATMPIDSDGNGVLMNKFGETHVVVDVIAYMNKDELGDDIFLDTADTRAIDTRNGLPFEIPPQPSCDKVAWLEKYVDDPNNPSVFSYRYAVYNDVNGQVTRYDTTATTEPRQGAEIMPGQCGNDTIVYSSFNAATGKQDLYAMDLSDGTVTRIPVAQNPAFYNPSFPDPTINNGVGYLNRTTDPGGGEFRDVLTSTGEFWASSAVELSFSDNASMLAVLQKYNLSPDLTLPYGNYMRALVLRRNPLNPAEQQVFGHQFSLDTGERMSGIKSSNDGEHAYVLRSMSSSQPMELYKIDWDPTTRQSTTDPMTKPAEMIFTPVQLPGVQPGSIMSIDAIGNKLLVLVQDGNIVRPIVYDLDNGSREDLSPATPTFAGASD